MTQRAASVAIGTMLVVGASPSATTTPRNPIRGHRTSAMAVASSRTATMIASGITSRNWSARGAP
jgi:hypothetical protein